MLLLTAPRQAVLGWFVLTAGIGSSYLFFYLDVPETTLGSVKRQSVEPILVGDSADSISMEPQPGHAISAVSTRSSSSMDTPSLTPTQILPVAAGWPTGSSMATIEAILSGEDLPEAIPKNFPVELESMTTAQAWTPNSTSSRPNAVQAGALEEIAILPLEPIIMNRDTVSNNRPLAHSAVNALTGEQIVWPETTFASSKSWPASLARTPTLTTTHNLAKTLSETSTPSLLPPSTLRPVSASLDPTQPLTSPSPQLSNSPPNRSRVQPLSPAEQQQRPFIIQPRSTNP